MIAVIPPRIIQIKDEIYLAPSDEKVKVIDDLDLTNKPCGTIKDMKTILADTKTYLENARKNHKRSA